MSTTPRTDDALEGAWTRADMERRLTELARDLERVAKQIDAESASYFQVGPIAVVMVNGERFVPEAQVTTLRDRQMNGASIAAKNIATAQEGGGLTEAQIYDAIVAAVKF